MTHKPHATPLRDASARSQSAFLRRTDDARCSLCGRRADGIVRAKGPLFAGLLCLGCLAAQRSRGHVTEVIA